MKANGANRFEAFSPSSCPIVGLVAYSPGSLLPPSYASLMEVEPDVKFLSRNYEIF